MLSTTDGVRIRYCESHFSQPWRRFHLLHIQRQRWGVPQTSCITTVVWYLFWLTNGPTRTESSHLAPCPDLGVPATVSTTLLTANLPMDLIVARGGCRVSLRTVINILALPIPDHPALAIISSRCRDQNELQAISNKRLRNFRHSIEAKSTIAVCSFAQGHGCGSSDPLGHLTMQDASDYPWHNHGCPGNYCQGARPVKHVTVPELEDWLTSKIARSLSHEKTFWRRQGRHLWYRPRPIEAPATVRWLMVLRVF